VAPLLTRCVGAALVALTLLSAGGVAHVAGAARSYALLDHAMGTLDPTVATAVVFALRGSDR
jgi:hypothetical protein